MTWIGRLSIGFTVLAISSCSSKEAGSPAKLLSAPAASEGFQLGMKTKVAPYAETWACQVGFLPNAAMIGGHAVTHRTSRPVHHLTISLPATAGVGLDEGMYDCNKLFADHPKLMEATQIYGGQGSEARLTLPEGVAAKIPGSMQILFELHYVNASAENIDLEALVNVYTMPIEKVKQGIWGTQMRNEKLFIPPKSEHAEVSRCVMKKDVDVLLLATHTHSLGKGTRVKTFDGKAAGPEVYRNDDWTTPLLKQFDKPLHVAAGSGFEMRCNYLNNTDRTVTYGLKSTDEMCNLTMVFTPDDVSATCDITYQSAGDPNPK